MSDEARFRIVAAARTWIGTPYKHQASTKGAGVDCLGLIRGVWRETVGPEAETVPPYSSDWGETDRCELLWAAALRHLRPADLPGQTGDVVLFRMRENAIAKHLGVLGEGGATFIHAYSGHGVLEHPMSDPWRRRIVAAFEFPHVRI